MKGRQRTRYSNGCNSDAHTEDDGSPRYCLEHLATFSVGPEFGLLLPKDGLHRLLQMEKSNGIWTQKMQMKLERDWVIILDDEDGDVVERFPMCMISSPTAYTSDDPRELYNNILVFIVTEDPKGKTQNPSEMHIFQCTHVYAQDVVDEMKAFMTGKVQKYNESAHYLPPPPTTLPPDPPVPEGGLKLKEHAVLGLQSRNLTASQQKLEGSTSYSKELDETSSTTSEKYEREVAILNHCFDDIERFVVRLQHAAAAYKELERRQKSRKSTKKDMGDGMLSIRAKPPPEREFVDVLQKFKLSFNLLAKLKSHIHDPNAPELVHFLFTPLALIVDAARDTSHSPNMAARVISPLLTHDAIELLANCCTSKETDLWHNLGDSWIIPRDRWKGYESNYRPVFSNGWAPENPIDDHTSGNRSVHQSDAELHEQNYQRLFAHPERSSHCSSECFDSEQGDDQDHMGLASGIPELHLRSAFDSHLDGRQISAKRSTLERDNTIHSTFSTDSADHDLPPPQRQFDRQQMQWLDELKGRHAKIVQVVYPRTANNEKELTVVRGEILEVLDDSRKWWKARNMYSQIAHVPHTIVSPYPSADDDVFSNPIYTTQANKDTCYSMGNPLKDQFRGEEKIKAQSPVSSTHGTQPVPVDWIRQERQGKKGEFRYF